MIDLNDLRQRPDAYAEAARRKRFSIDINAFVELDKEYRQLKVVVDELRSKQNAFNKELPKLGGEEKQKRIVEMKELAIQLKENEKNLSELEEKWSREQLLIPSIPLASVPDGKDDSENVEKRRWGEIPKFSFTLKDHVQLGSELDIIDIERGVKIGGSRCYFLKGDGVRLQHAILQLAMDRLHSKGYTLMDPPHIVKYDAMAGTGYFPGGEEQAYSLDERDKGFYLIGTSEVSVASYHKDEILQLSDLPKRYAGYSPCYRREAGTYGKDTHGLYRIHQFYKVEQVIICRADPEESMRFHQEILGNAEELLQLMKIPYRVVDVCSGDMGIGQVYKNDIEAWMPSRNNYGETHSCSSLYDFQSRRLGLRYKDENGKSTYCYTLNNTCIASPRVLIPLLEIYQNEDGTVTIPEVLRPYMGGQERIVKG
ncbi:MAG: serine--tRNA ligase [SAR324 cluster bacterium]|uniref:Serine--tRNA ligase n=1 Tax=SAR324 cluster bacterium TaxID=2024889 RepID=A0A7X9IJ95_9DELT|nr:serine--tRNA ligase [SAR324 cluster bacterium]